MTPVFSRRSWLHATGLASLLGTAGTLVRSARLRGAGAPAEHDGHRAPAGGHGHGLVTVGRVSATAFDPAVFVPRPRVGSALLRLRRTGPAPPERMATIVRLAFAHRRKSLARSLEHARAGSLEPARRALERIGKRADARAETLSPAEFDQLADALGGEGEQR